MSKTIERYEQHRLDKIFTKFAKKPYYTKKFDFNLEFGERAILTSTIYKKTKWYKNDKKIAFIEIYLSFGSATIYVRPLEIIDEDLEEVYRLVKLYEHQLPKEENRIKIEIVLLQKQPHLVNL